MQRSRRARSGSDARASRKCLLRDTMLRMTKQRQDRFGLARFGEPALLVLMSLLDGPKHGHAIIKDIDGSVGVHLGPGTLYGALAKLEERGLVAALEPSGRRRPYEITAEGRTAVAENIARWERVVRTTAARTRTAES
jgi:DNA-binding PadR family transcriptional regulator